MDKAVQIGIEGRHGCKHIQYLTKTSNQYKELTSSIILVNMRSVCTLSPRSFPATAGVCQVTRSLVRYRKTQTQLSNFIIVIQWY